MRPLKTLTFEAFRDELALTFAQIADKRESHRITWEMPAVLMSAFAMLFFQHPSLLEYQRRMQKRTGHSNLERVFAVKEIPSDTRMRGRSITRRCWMEASIFIRRRFTARTVCASGRPTGRRIIRMSSLGPR